MTSQTTVSPAHAPTGAYTGCRYFVALMLLTYGFAKINGAQFTILDSELDKPMGDVSGFWLTWYYFGYSPFYGNAIALVQIAGAVLLTFRRTTLLAACLLSVVVGNILLVDLFYGIDLGALLMAAVLAGCLAYILSAHRAELIELFWSRQNRVYARAAKMPRAAHAGVVMAIVVCAACFTWYGAHSVNRAPTPIDGRWQVLSGTHRVPEMPEPLSHVYFELNRAHMVVLRFGDRWSPKHHFLVDTAAREIQMWRFWNQQTRDQDRLFTGTYELEGDRLVLRGQFAGSPAPSVLVLRRAGHERS